MLSQAVHMEQPKHIPLWRGAQPSPSSMTAADKGGKLTFPQLPSAPALAAPHSAEQRVVMPIDCPFFKATEGPSNSQRSQQFPSYCNLTGGKGKLCYGGQVHPILAYTRAYLTQLLLLGTHSLASMLALSG